MDKKEIISARLKDIITVHKVDNYNDFCSNYDAAWCLEVYNFTLLEVSWQLFAQLGSDSIPVSPEDPSSGTFHRIIHNRQEPWHG